MEEKPTEKKERLKREKLATPERMARNDDILRGTEIVKVPGIPAIRQGFPMRQETARLAQILKSMAAGDILEFRTPKELDRKAATNAAAMVTKRLETAAKTIDLGSFLIYTRQADVYVHRRTVLSPEKEVFGDD